VAGCDFALEDIESKRGEPLIKRDSLLEIVLSLVVAKDAKLIVLS